MGILGKSRPAKKVNVLKKAQLALQRAQGTRTYHGKPLSKADKGALGMNVPPAIRKIIKRNAATLDLAKKLKKK